MCVLIAPCLVNFIMADMEVVGICIGADPELDIEGPSDSFYCLFHARTFLVHMVGKFFGTFNDLLPPRYLSNLMTAP